MNHSTPSGEITKEMIAADLQECADGNIGEPSFIAIEPTGTAL